MRKKLLVYAAVVASMLVAPGAEAHVQAYAWKIAFTSSGAGGTVVGDISSTEKAACIRGRAIRVVVDGDLWGRARTDERGHFEIARDPFDPSDRLTVKVAAKVLRGDANHRHYCPKGSFDAT